MIAVVQRVSEARVKVPRTPSGASPLPAAPACGTESEADGQAGWEVVGEIRRGLCVLLGVERSDGEPEAVAMAAKLVKLRIFPTSDGPEGDGKMNRSVVDIGGGILVISQFTLVGDTSGGNRPSFTNAAPPDVAEPLYERVVRAIRESGVQTATGRFRTHMSVSIVNEGPVTILVRA